MPSQAEALYDSPQSIPPENKSFYQNVRVYENQQITTPTPDADFVIGMRSGGGVLSCYYSSQPKQDFTAQLQALQPHYTILDDDRTFIDLLATEPALHSLLIEAVEPLQHAFGDKRLIYIRILSSDEDSILKVTIRLPANFGVNPESALRAFDDEWWLNNCHRSRGVLVFDYEMQNAF